MIVSDVAGVERCSGFEEDEVDFLNSYRLVLDTAGDDDELTFVEGDIGLSAETNGECAFDDVEEFIFVCVVMPDEFALEFGDAQVLTVEFGEDAWLPMLGDVDQVLLDVYFLNH